MAFLIQFGVLCAACLLYSIWTVVYRLFWHPLARFPGPKIAAMTKWYEFYFDIIKYPGGMYMHEINRMHEEYGPIVRINPEEVHVKDSDWFGTLYCWPALGVRDKYPPAAHMTGTPDSVFGTISHEIHRKRRAVLNPFFSKATVASSENIVHENMEILDQLLRRKLANKEIVELRQTCLAFTTDTVSRYATGRSLNLLVDEQAAFEWKDTVYAVATSTVLIKQFTWIIPLALKMPTTLLRMIVPKVARVMSYRMDIHRQAGTAILEHKSSPKSDSAQNAPSPNDGTVFDLILGSKTLPDEEKSHKRLTEEGFDLLIAGGETSSRILTTAMYHILANKERVLPRLKAELSGILVDRDTRPDVKDLEKLSWLTAIIKESSRIAGLVTSRMPLISPLESLKYGEWEIPAGTPIGMTLRDVLLDPSIFNNPHDFQPERWLPGNPDLGRVKQFDIPFGRGSHMCIGMHLALAELYIVISCLFWRFELELVDTIRERDVESSRDCFLGGAALDSPGVRVRVLNRL